MTKLKIDHLGDGVYATLLEDCTLILTANHHEVSQASDVIYLELWVQEALERFLKEIK